MTGPGDFFCRAAVGLPLWTDDVLLAPDAGFFLRRFAAGRDVSAHNTLRANGLRNQKEKTGDKMPFNVLNLSGRISNCKF